MPEFFTLEEAARVLGLSPDELKTKAQHREIRAFMDGGSWRFRKPDVEEEARRRGMGSDPDLSLSDLDMTTGPAIDFSEFQLGVADPDLAPESVEMPPQGGLGPDSGAQDILLDDRTTPPVPSGSASTIIGMSASTGGKQPSDSDVKLLPDLPSSGASDSDVRLGGFGLSDSNVTLVGDDLMADAASPFTDDKDTDPNATLAQAPHFGSSDDLPVSSGASASDFELSPSSVIKSLEPESGSDFELTAMDASSDEFDATPLRSPGDSDVTGGGLSASGVNLSRPSDSGINLLGPGAFDFNSADSIELAPLDDVEDEPKARPAPAAASASPPAAAAKSGKADLSATALPIKQEKDIFEDTDFEVDALDSGSGSDDQTVQLEAASDFDVEEQGDSASEVFAIDEDDVDQNAATAMAPAPRDDAGGMDDDEDSEDSAWDMDEPATSSQAVRVAAAPMFAQTAGQEWGGLWVGLLALATVFTLLLAFVGLDLVRNLYYFQGDGPASGLVRQLASLAGG